MNIKPIKTTYKGREFASKLEARWALFLDMCDIPWIYEPNGMWQAPDFELFGMTKTFRYLEVKGSLPSRDCIQHMRRIGCQLIAVGGFFMYREPRLIQVTAQGVRGLAFYGIFNYRIQFNRACEHRFDIE